MANKIPPYTQFTLKELKSLGYLTGKVETFNFFAAGPGVRQDLFGFIDIIALAPKPLGNHANPHILAVQSTSHGCKSGHYKKITIERKAQALTWLLAGGLIELWTWKKEKNRWKHTITPITLKDISPEYDFL